MQNYIKQLIEDIHSAKLVSSIPLSIWDTVDFDNELEIEDISYVEKYYYGEEKYISEITGIDSMLLPPSEMLDDSQRILLVKELEGLLNSRNFEIEFPVSYPIPLRYELLRGLWDEKHVEVSYGTNHIDFCNWDFDTCPFKEYCRICKDVEEDMLGLE